MLRFVVTFGWVLVLWCYGSFGWLWLCGMVLSWLVLMRWVALAVWCSFNSVVIIHYLYVDGCVVTIYCCGWLADVVLALRLRCACLLL